VSGAIRRHPGRTAAVLAAGALVAVAGFLWFRPDRLFTDREVSEALPGAAAEAMAEMPAEEPAGDGVAAPTTTASGEFVSLEHETRGMALVVETGGKRFLRFEDFETSDGPDLLVYLSAKEPTGPDDWYGYDRNFVALGDLKGNVGNQNYAIPANVDLDRYSTAVVWCRRFEVGFAAAVLQ
jgi:hypothetical protein